MFTGIVSGKGHVQKIIKCKDYISLIIRAPKGFSKNLLKGASVSVNGVCLTVKKGKTDTLEFDVIEETLKKTNLKNISTSSKVNLERSMTAKTEIGGHLVSGHIHGTGQVQKVIDRKETRLQTYIAPHILRYYIFTYIM